MRRVGFPRNRSTDAAACKDSMEEEEEEEEEAVPALAAHLVAPALYPNAVKWSDDNLIAVATSQLITILNPASIEGPRGFVTASSDQPFNVGRVQPADMQAPCLLPVGLSRNLRAVVRSMDWSPQGLAPNGGCLLAVCTKDHRVKLYRAPYCEFQSEWVEVLDLSEILYQHFCQSRFTKLDHAKDIKAMSFVNFFSKARWSYRSSKEPQHRKEQKLREELVEDLNAGTGGSWIHGSIDGEKCNAVVVCRDTAQADNELNAEKTSSMQEGPSFLAPNGKEGTVASFSQRDLCLDTGCAIDLDENGKQSPQCSAVIESTCILQDQRSGEPASEFLHLDLEKDSNSCISSLLYTSYINRFAYVVVAWSLNLRVECLISDLSKKRTENFVLIAMGAKSGEVSVLRASYPHQYTLELATSIPEVNLVGVFEAHGSWISALCWGKGCKTIYNKDGIAAGHEEEIFLATGSSDGSVKVWAGDVRDFNKVPSSSGTVPLSLIKQVIPENSSPVTSIALTISARSSENIQVAVGKASGSLLVLEIDMSGKHCREVHQIDAHSQMVTGIVWAFDGSCLYTCSQDDGLQAWMFSGSGLLALPFPQGSALFDSKFSDTSSNLPNSVLDGYFGLDLSKGSLALATVRGVSTEMLDPMYQSRSIKSVAQVFWIGSQHFAVPPPTHVPCGLQDIRCGIPSSDLAQWYFNVLSALHHFENTSHNLVLWDVMISLNSLKAVAGNGFLNLVVTTWLLELGIVISEVQDGLSLLTKSYQASLLEASSRSLHIVSVIVRRLYLPELNPFIDDRKFSMASELSSCADQTASMSGCPGNVWQRLLLDVEHELRQRIVHLTLSSIASCMQLYTNTSKKLNSAGVRCMLQWALANTSVVSPQLLVESQKVRQILRWHGQTELCSICKETVPFDSAEMGQCQGSESHKLPRCAATFEICPPGPLWFCHCCTRWASEQLRTLFFTLSSGKDIEQTKEVLDLCGSVQPFCPFCGILMQRFLPDCFLRLCLV